MSSSGYLSKLPISFEVDVTFFHPVGSSTNDAAFRASGFQRFTSANLRSSRDRVLSGTLHFSTQQNADEFRLRFFHDQRQYPNVKTIEFETSVSSLSKSAFVFFSDQLHVRDAKQPLTTISGLCAFKPRFSGPGICQSGEVQFTTEDARKSFMAQVERALIPTIVRAVSKDEWITCQTCGKSLGKNKKCCDEELRLMQPLLVPDELKRSACDGWTTIQLEQPNSHLSQTQNSQNIVTALCDAFNNPRNFPPGMLVFPFATAPLCVRAHCVTSIKSMIDLTDPHAYFQKACPDLAQVLHGVLDTADLGDCFGKARTVKPFIPALGNFVSGTPDGAYRGMPVELKTVENWDLVRKNLPKWLRQIAVYQLGSNTEAFLVIANRSTKEIACFEIALENIQTASEFWHHALSTNPLLAENFELTREYNERVSAHLESGCVSACTAFRDMLPRLERMFQSRVCELDQDPEKTEEEKPEEEKKLSFDEKCLKRLETMKHLFRE
jgi:hypothetical protein